MARMSLDDLRTRASTVDRAKLDATTEADITAQRAADGDADLDVPESVEVIEPPRALRVRLGMTQTEMAEALKIPVGTWRNWEQGRTKLEPTALALLRIVSRHPAVLWINPGSGEDTVQVVAPLTVLGANYADPGAPVLRNWKGRLINQQFGDFALAGSNSPIPSALRSAKVKRPIAGSVAKKDR